MKRGASARARHQRAPSWWRAWGTGTLAAFVLLAMWAVTMPLYSGPDEPSHMSHSAALYRGQLIGRSLDAGSPFVLVKVPGTLGFGGHVVACYWFDPAIPAACGSSVRLTHSTVEALSYTTRYPPLYYALTGWVTIVEQSPSAVIFTRLVSALLCALLFGLTYMVLVVWSRNRLLPLGFLCALTPVTVYICSLVNPSGPEIASAICLWCSGSVLVLEQRRDPPPGLVVVLALSAGAMILTRGLSPLFAVLCFGTLAALGGFKYTRLLFQTRRDVRRAVLGLLFLSVAAVVWTEAAHGLWVLPAGPALPPHPSVLDVVRAALRLTPSWVNQMVGVVGGGHDVRLPTVTIVLWVLVLAVLIGLAVRARNRRGMVVIGALAVLCLALPVVLSLPGARTIGLGWQGRYTLPLAVGVPILAAAVGGRATRAPRPWLAWSAAVALGGAGLLGYLETLRRYAVGVHGPLDFVGGPWHPVEGWPVALMWSVGAYALLVATFMRLPTRWGKSEPGGLRGTDADAGDPVGAEGFEPSLGAV